MINVKDFLKEYNEHKIKEFLDDYNELTERHGLYISPRLKVVGENMCRGALKVVNEDSSIKCLIEWDEYEDKWSEANET